MAMISSVILHLQDRVCFLSWAFIHRWQVGLYLVKLFQKVGTEVGAEAGQHEGKDR